MTRRDFVLAAAAAPGAPSRHPPPLVVPVHRVTDRRMRCPPEQFHRFWWSIWPEAVRDFGHCGIEFQCSDETGEIRRSPGDRPVFFGLIRGRVNLVITDHIPMAWDRGRALAGVTVLHEGYCVCVIALRYAHGNQIPFLSTNTCVHEMLHAFMLDIFLDRPGWFQAGERESRIDWYATQLWLSRDGKIVLESAKRCLVRLQSSDSRK